MEFSSFDVHEKNALYFNEHNTLLPLVNISMKLKVELFHSKMLASSILKPPFTSLILPFISFKMKFAFSLISSRRLKNMR